MIIWKDIEGYECLYLISNEGEIKSMYNYGGRGHTIKPKIKKTGYLEIGLRKNGIKKYYLVHRLVAKAFIPNPLINPCVNHIDEDKTNNKVSNLEWCDAHYNNTYGTRIDRCIKKTSKAVIQKTNDGIEIAKYKSVSEAYRKTKIRASSIVSNIKGVYKHAGGYQWCYSRER